MRAPVLLPALAVAALLGGVAGGLARLGLTPFGHGDWLGRAAEMHGALMISGFLASVIALERAVALKQRWAFAVPLLSGSAGLLLLAGLRGAGAALGAAAALGFIAVNLQILRRQLLAHTLLLMAGALCWLVGSVAFLLQRPGFEALPWWFALLVLTIAAERLEMTRLMRRRPAAQVSLFAVLALLLVGAALSGALYGAALAALAVWLLRHDIARRTVRAGGLSRYMAVCLLGGYGWLAVAGLAWAATSLGWPARDAAQHALGLGFVFSMVMGHAPVILPAIAGVKLQYGPAFYAPLALLHLSLLVRLVPGHTELVVRALGGLLHTAALLLFVLTLAVAALLWRARRHHTGALRRKA